MDDFELRYVPEFMYKFKYASNMNAYFCTDGVHLLTYKSVKDELQCHDMKLYTWDNFEFLHFYYEKNNDQKGVIKRFSFTLNNIPFFDNTWQSLLRIIQEYTLNTPSKRNLLLNLLTQRINDPLKPIKELIIADIIGFTENGWQMPHKFYFVSGNDFREEIENNIRGLIEYTIPESINIPTLFRKMYETTTIDYKDYIIAYGCVAPFLFALRGITKLMPLLALGGPGGKGKTAILEYMTVKWWQNIPEIVGSALMDSKPRVQGTLTGSTIPVCVDDCEDLKDFVTGIFKRYTTTHEKVKKLNPDQTKKMDCEYCSPVMMSFNALPIMFEDPAFRQRILMLYIENVIESEEWLDIYNDIPDKAIGKYIYLQTKDMSFKKLVELYRAQPTLGMKSNRQKAIIRLMMLGKYFTKQWFNIDLDLRQLPYVIKKTLMAGNEELVDLIIKQIDESKEFIFNQDGGFENPNRKSWVKYPVSEFNHNGAKGYLYTVNNAYDISDRMNRRKKFSLKNLMLILETEWDSISYDSFYVKGTMSGTVRGIFIPLNEINGSKALLEDHLREEEESNGQFDEDSYNVSIAFKLDDLEKQKRIEEEKEEEEDKDND